MTGRTLLAALPGLIFVAAIGAQRTWIVDSAGGVGAHFSDLPAAFATAVHGDTLLVRSGSYTGASTDQGLRVLCDPQTFVVLSDLVVHDLPVGRVFVLDDLATLGGRVVLRRNAGVVVMSGLRVVGESVVDQCRTVLVSDSVFQALDVTASSLALTACSATGSNLHEPTIESVASDVFLAGCHIGGASQTRFLLVAQPAVDAVGGRLFVSDRVSLVGGASWPGNLVIEPGIRASATEVHLDPAATVDLPVAGVTPVIRTVPGLTTTDAPLGGTAEVRVTAPAGTPVVLGASVPAPFAPSPFGLLALDVATAVIGGVGTTDPTGLAPFLVPVPPLQQILGTPLGVQGVVLLPTGLQLSTPGALIVH